MKDFIFALSHPNAIFCVMTKYDYIVKLIERLLTFSSEILIIFESQLDANRIYDSMLFGYFLTGVIENTFPLLRIVD